MRSLPPGTVATVGNLAGLYLSNFRRGAQNLGVPSSHGPKTVPCGVKGHHRLQPDNVVLYWFTMTQCYVEPISNRQVGSSKELKSTPIAVLYTMQEGQTFLAGGSNYQPPANTTLTVGSPLPYGSRRRLWTHHCRELPASISPALPESRVLTDDSLFPTIKRIVSRHRKPRTHPVTTTR